MIVMTIRRVARDLILKRTHYPVQTTIRPGHAYGLRWIDALAHCEA